MCIYPLHWRRGTGLHTFDVFLHHRGWIGAVQIGLMLSASRMCIKATMAGVGSEVSINYKAKKPVTIVINRQHIYRLLDLISFDC